MSRMLPDCDHIWSAINTEPRVLDGPNGDDAVTVWVYTRQCYECGKVEEWQ